MMTAPNGLAPADVAERLADVRRRIVAASRAAGRDPGDITLVAVTKGQTPDAIAAAWAKGERHFGESRVQEAERHWAAPGTLAGDGRVLHLIGPLQTNKLRPALALFDAIHTLDREKLARALHAAMAAGGRRVDCFLEVNIGSEPQKSGVAPEAAEAFVSLCREELRLPVVGLMCIPPAGAEPSPYFALLREIARRCGLPRLSMGMSADYELAIAFGATHVRVGSAIFGPRG
jgi:PLP dependent protein